MKELSETEIIELFSKTIDDLSHGVGIFEVEDLNDIKSIRYVFMNKIVLYEMRKQREEVFGKKIHEVAPEAYGHEGGLYVIESYRKVAKEGGSINLGLVEYSNHMVAGIYECSVHHIQNNYIYVMLRNVTELEQTKNELELKKNELELKNEELSQFAYMASHDLKEPLRTISGFVQLIEKKYHEKFDDNARKLLNFISVATVRMRNLINDLLEYSNVGEEKEMVLVDCEKLVKVIQQDLGAIIKETNTTFDVGKLPHIKGYETQLRMLFQNLISNGIKFSKSEGAPKITISAEEQNGWTFSIQDEGIGIADVHSDKIFTAFKRLHSTSEYEGTGIGLAHCKKIVELHKGRIWVKSKEGEGSTFYFTIPNQ